MKIRTFIGTTLLAATLGLGYTSAVHAHGDALTVYVYDRDYCPVHRVYHGNSYYGYRNQDRHGHHKKFLKHNTYRHERFGHKEHRWNKDRDYRHGSHDGDDHHHRHDKASRETGMRYTQRH